MNVYLDKTKSFLSKCAGKVGNRNTLLIILGVVIAIAALYYLYTMFFKSHKEPFEAGKDGQKQAELMFFFANWCPHCKEAKPEWFALKEAGAGKTINGYHVIYTEVDCTDNSDDVQKKQSRFGIEGYPTVLLLKDNKKIDFNGKPAKANLEEFLKANLA